MGNAQLRRAQLAFAAACAAEWAFTVALSVVAYRDGGAAAVGLVALLRMAAVRRSSPRRSAPTPTACAASASSIASLPGAGRRDRRGRRSCSPRTARSRSVYALAVVADDRHDAVPGGAHRAAAVAVLDAPSELTSINVVRGMLDSLSLLLGPLAAAALLEWTSAEAAFAATAAAAALAALALAGLRYEAAAADGGAVTGLRGGAGRGAARRPRRPRPRGCCSGRTGCRRSRAAR